MTCVARAINICAAARGDNCDLDPLMAGANTLKTELAEDVCREIEALAKP
jgi:hypothetical protein